MQRLSRYPDPFSIVALLAGSNLDRLHRTTATGSAGNLPRSRRALLRRHPGGGVFCTEAEARGRAYRRAIFRW